MAAIGYTYALALSILTNESDNLSSDMFLASINPSSAELNFPSTPVPLLGFHG